MEDKGEIILKTEQESEDGVDIRIFDYSGEIQRKSEAIVQCKAWDSYKVGVKIVRELFGAMTSEEIERGMVITSGEFTEEAKLFAEEKRMVLLSGYRFLQQPREFPVVKQQGLLYVALEGEYRAPRCPHCDIKMTLREGIYGKNPNSIFWGCVRYPDCRQSFVFMED